MFKTYSSWGLASGLESKARLGTHVFRKRHFRCSLMLFSAVTMVSAGCGKMGLPPAGPPDVQVVQVVQKDVPISQSWVATFDGLVNANIHAQVSGLLLKQ